MTVTSKIFKDKPTDWAHVEEIEHRSNKILEMVLTAFETMPDDQYRKVMDAVRSEGGLVGQVAEALGGTGVLTVKRMEAIREIEYKCGECEEAHKATGLEMVHQCVAAIEAVATARRFRAHCKARACDNVRAAQERPTVHVNGSGTPTAAPEAKATPWKERFLDRLKREAPNLGPYTTAAHVVLGGPDGAEPPAEFLDSIVENIKTALK